MSKEGDDYISYLASKLYLANLKNRGMPAGIWTDVPSNERSHWRFLARTAIKTLEDKNADSGLSLAAALARR
ncbi:MAG: hypothetical protein JWR75_306 [Devosia sp.]|nr:hypothetical protein [Devosia sp.]